MPHASAPARRSVSVLPEIFLPVALGIATGAVAGLLAGLLGVGGGLVMVPALVVLLAKAGTPPALVMQMALATSLGTIFFTGISSVRAHHALGAVRMDLVRQLAPMLLLGSFAGTFVADALGSARLELLFGLFAAAIGLRMLFAKAGKAGGHDVPERAAARGAHPLAGTAIGVASALFGIGGGSLTVPWLTRFHVRMQQAVATSAACGLPIAMAAGTGYIIAGWEKPGLPAASLGYIHLPSLLALAVASVPMAKVGARLAHRLPAAILKKVFAAVLLLVAGNFLFG